MSSTSERLVLEALERLGVAFEPFTIDPDFADTAAFCEKYGYPPERTCNTIIVASKKDPKQYCACTVLSPTRLDVNKKVTKLMGISKAMRSPNKSVVSKLKRPVFLARDLSGLS